MNVRVKVIANASKNMVKSENDYLKVYVTASRDTVRSLDREVYGKV